jgi:nickel transport protein
MNRNSLLPVLVAGGLLLAPVAGQAHGIQSNLERLSGLQASLDSSFSNGLPASNANVRLVPPGGTPIELGHTDAQGHLSFQLPAKASTDWEIQVDAGPGHRDYLEVPSLPKGRAAAVSHSESPLEGSLHHLLALALVGSAGILGGLLITRPRA